MGDGGIVCGRRGPAFSGGYGEGDRGLSDVWRLKTAGSNDRNPTHTYTTPGTYTVTLQVYNNGGYNATRMNITVTDPVPPTANFTANQTSGTAPLAVQFNDTSTGSPIVWNRSFGDGTWYNTTDAAERNVTHTYAAAGNYTVSLTVSNAAGSNTSTRTDYIWVSAAPTPTPTSQPSHGGGGGKTGGPDGYNVGGDSAVSKVNVTGTGLSRLIVTGWAQSSPGSGIPPVPGIPYQYINLVPARFETITGATITFTVPVAWLDEHNLTAEEMVMYRYNGTAWEALPTTVVEITGTSATFTATSPGFGLSAITGIKQPEEPATTPTATAEPTATQTTAAPAGEPAPEIPLGTFALIGLLILVLAAGGYLVRRWWRRRQNPGLSRDYD